MLKGKVNAKRQDNPEAFNTRCPYCGAKPGEDCRVRQGNYYTQGSTPRDLLGNPLLHLSRINATVAAK